MSVWKKRSNFVLFIKKKNQSRKNALARTRETYKLSLTEKKDREIGLFVTEIF